MTRLDISTFGGLFVACACIVGGLVFEGGKVADISQATAALIVAGGTLGAVLITTPFELFVRAMKRSAEAFVVRPQPYAPILKQLLAAADGARRNGLTSLENYSSERADPFFVKALNLASDGADPGQLREMMLLDLDCEQERAESEIRVWENAAGYSPTIGIVGAVLGLIQVMKHLDNLDEVGRGIAVAFVATVYGVTAANLLLLPIAGKLRARSHDIERLHKMVLEGVLAIANGMNPSLIRIKLEPFLGPKVDRVAAQPARMRPASVPVETIQLAPQ